MKMAGHRITFKEVPQNISLTIWISGCPYRCKGCHTPRLQEDIGEELTLRALKELLKTKGVLCTSCVCFMGGDHEIVQLKKFLLTCKKRGFKTALYTGRHCIPETLRSVVDYIKVGPYIESAGALDSHTTNQRMYKNSGGDFIDITSYFQKKRTKC